MGSILTAPLDLVGKEIKPGDWIVQSMMTGRSGSIKIAYVVETSANEFKAVTFSSYPEGNWEPGTGSGAYHGKRYVVTGRTLWTRSKAYRVSNTNRSFVINKDQVPKDMLEYIEAELGGDPMSNLPEKV